jgi:NhaC family Na+:H+ antiporter
MSERQPVKISLVLSLIPIVFLTGLLVLNVVIYGVDSTSGPNQLALIFAASLAMLIAIRYGITWKTLEVGMMNSILTALPAILILLLIGSLAGTWIISGIVPTMIYYGLKLLSPSIFLLATCFICSIISLATGSSWTTVATIGLALAGVGETLGLHAGYVGGAVISGAYFGDKISPLSDTTNLASSMAGVSLFTHIQYMLYTTIPSIVLSLILYGIMGLSISSTPNIESINEVMNTLENNFTISPALLVVPLLVIVLVIAKTPAFPALLIGTLAGGVFAIIFQTKIIQQIAHVDTIDIKVAYMVVLKAMYTSISLETGNEIVNGLLKSNGMEGMLNTVWLILSAMVFGGVMEATGMLENITAFIIKQVNSLGSLVASTVGTCIFFNITASDQYLSIIVPGRMFKKTYDKMGLKPQNLSRTLEDSGTVTSVLVPWNTCGATQAAVLGIATFAYAPYSFFNIISPLMTILFAYFNIRIARNKPETSQ